jgi:hypothetical protein
MSSPSPATPPLKATAAKHLALARQNYQTYQRLKDSGQDLDWAVTVLFYTALHLVQAYFVQQAVTAFDIPQSHKERTTRIGLKLLPIYSHYRTLQDLSRDARYEPDHIVLTPKAVQQYEDLDFVPIAVELRQRGISLDP